MTTEPTTSRHNPMKVIFNYQNVFFSFFMMMLMRACTVPENTP